jgi:hypothetical protein
LLVPSACAIVLGCHPVLLRSALSIQDFDFGNALASFACVSKKNERTEGQESVRLLYPEFGRFAMRISCLPGFLVGIL